MMTGAEEASSSSASRSTSSFRFFISNDASNPKSTISFLKTGRDRAQLKPTHLSRQRGRRNLSIETVLCTPGHTGALHKVIRKIDLAVRFPQSQLLIHSHERIGLLIVDYEASVSRVRRQFYLVFVHSSEFGVGRDAGREGEVFVVFEIVGEKEGGEGLFC